MARLKVETIHGRARREILKGLLAYNKGAAGEFGHKRVTITLRERGKIVGGLAGEIFFGWLYVSLFWISEDYRGRGFGSKLMKAAEKEARRRGVKHAWLDTFSFQAPAFYRKLGYREFGRLKNFPAGHVRSFLTKAL
jgi:ribosomal protein S18 acetylase RimI-like enzyme